MTSSSKCSLKRVLQLYYQDRDGVGEKERWNMDLKGVEETVVQPELLFDLWMSSGTWEATNIPPQFSFWLYRYRVCASFYVCKTLFTLLLSLVKGCCPLSLIIFPTASHTHFHPETFSFLLRCWFAFPKPPTHPPFILPQGSCTKPALLCRPEKV